jgi:IclR family mhp operon transcriptional activator
MAIDDRLLRVIRVLNAYGPMTVLELSRRAEFSRAAVYRIVETLCEGGYLRRITGTSSVQLTWLVKTLSSGYREADRVEEAGAEAISWLQEQVRWPTSLGIPEKGYILVKESTRFRSPFVFDMGGVGLKLPMYTSALGLAYFCSVPKETKEIIVDINGRRNQDKPPTPSQQRMIIERGWAMRKGGIQPKTASVASPIFFDGTAVGAICITFGVSVIPQAKAISQFVPPLREACQRVSTALLEPRPSATNRHEHTRGQR